MQGDLDGYRQRLVDEATEEARQKRKVLKPRASTLSPKSAKVQLAAATALPPTNRETNIAQHDATTTNAPATPTPQPLSSLHHPRTTPEPITAPFSTITSQSPPFFAAIEGSKSLQSQPSAMASGDTFEQRSSPGSRSPFLATSAKPFSATSEPATGVDPPAVKSLLSGFGTNTLSHIRSPSVPQALPSQYEPSGPTLHPRRNHSLDLSAAVASSTADVQRAASLGATGLGMPSAFTKQPAKPVASEIDGRSTSLTPTVERMGLGSEDATSPGREQARQAKHERFDSPSSRPQPTVIAADPVARARSVRSELSSALTEQEPGSSAQLGSDVEMPDAPDENDVKVEDEETAALMDVPFQPVELLDGKTTRWASSLMLRLYGARERQSRVEHFAPSTFVVDKLTKYDILLAPMLDVVVTTRKVAEAMATVRNLARDEYARSGNPAKSLKLTFDALHDEFSPKAEARLFSRSYNSTKMTWADTLTVLASRSSYITKRQLDLNGSGAMLWPVIEKEAQGKGKSESSVVLEYLTRIGKCKALERRVVPAADIVGTQENQIIPRRR